jgi:hypothetical protein
MRGVKRAFSPQPAAFGKQTGFDGTALERSSIHVNDSRRARSKAVAAPLRIGTLDRLLKV